MKTIAIAREFSSRLTNRDRYQGDGKFTGQQFRDQFLAGLDNEEVWKKPEPQIELDFTGVTRLGPSFANEAFGFFTKYARPEVVMEVIKFVNTTNVQEAIIREELESAFSGR